MKAELFISWRFLWGRRSERFVSLISLISILGIAIGVAALIVVLAVMSGFDKDLKEKIIGNYSHIVIEGSGPIRDYPKLLSNINGASHVVASSPFIQTQALLQTKRLARGVIVRGIDPVLESKVTAIDKYLVSADKDLSDGIFMGRELAYSLGLGIGDELTMISPKGKKFPFKVKGLFNSGMYEYDATVVFMSLAKAQETFELGDSATGISVKIDKLFLADSVKSQIQNSLGPDFYVHTWMERNKNFFAALKLEKITMFIILTLIVLVAAFNIISTLVVMVTEKTKDIGILKAIGLSKARIRWVFTILGLLIGFQGIALGSAAGISICLLLKKYQFIKLPADIYYLDRLPVSLELWPDVGMILIAAFLISLLSTLYPARKASGLNPVEALRYE